MHASDKVLYPTPWSGNVTGEKTAPPLDPDEAAIARFLAGDRSGFDELFDRYAGYVHSIVYGVLGDEEAAADVTQEVFLQVYRSLHVFRRGARFPTWLYRVALNKALDAARSARRRKLVPLSPSLEQTRDTEGDPAEHDEARDLRRRVESVLQSLPVHDREILALRYFRELSVSEIAEVLRCSPTAAKVRLFRARTRFKEAYHKMYPEERDD